MTKVQQYISKGFWIEGYLRGIKANRELGPEKDCNMPDWRDSVYAGLTKKDYWYVGFASATLAKAV